MSSGIRRKGKVKWFNVVKGYGFIVPEDGLPDVFVHQNVIHMEGFRSLDENEEVEFESHDTDKGVEATLVTGPEGQNCKGSSRRPVPKRRVPKLRCYNCGRFSDHIAAKCPFGPAVTGAGPPQTLAKLCYQCKSDQHLLKDCPEAPPPQPASGSPSAPSHRGGRGGRGGGRRGGPRAGKGETVAKDKNNTPVDEEHVKLSNGTSESKDVESTASEIASLSINANGEGETTSPP